MADNRLIVALDVPDMDSAVKLVEELGDSVGFYKVGMELFYSVGSPIITYLRERNKEVFLDLKLHDIPNTVANGLISLMKQGVSILNVHASGGRTMMQTAAKSLRAKARVMGTPCPKLIAVTVLTSIDQDDWRGLGQSMAIADQVVRLAKLAKSAGLDGVVASPQEAPLIRAACGSDFMIVTPGVRPQSTSLDDQRRVATPAAALSGGASHIVVGRPITQAQNPRAAALQIIREIEVV